MHENPKPIPPLTAPAPDRPVADAARRQRAGGIEARRHLLMTALQLFSEKGFAKTSTRAIAEAAGVNIAAISYYFGDKAGLYRSVFTEPFGHPTSDIEKFTGPHLTLRESLQGFIQGFLEPMKQGELIQQCMRLHFREMLEPTGLWEDEIDQQIKPAHAALLATLARHLGISVVDDELHRLAFGIAGLAIHLYMARDVIDSICPALLASPQAIDLWAAQMVDQAEAMVQLEAIRREKGKK
jgi:TetR/AcrR family transcriptional regulator, regulator of cefoperazone and chloramphenicol sensitivity